jgi:hypothetical protein
VPALTDPAYTTQVRLPKITAKVDATTSLGADVGAKVLRQTLPGWTKQDHAKAAKFHADAADRMSKEWSKVVNAAAQDAWGRDYQAGDYRISGIASDEFGDKFKDQLRKLVHDMSDHKWLSAAHDYCAKYNKT